MAVAVPESPSLTGRVGHGGRVRGVGSEGEVVDRHPSSEPVTLVSAQRAQKVCPGTIASPLIAPVTSVWLAGRLPTSAPTAAVVFGVEKSSEFTSTHPEAVTRLVAVRLYSKSRRSGPRLAWPKRHCSPV